MNVRIDASQAIQAINNIKPTSALMREIGRNCTQPMIDYQKSHAPRDTGKTAESVTYEITSITGMTIDVEVGPTTPYAPSLEYGTGEFAEGGGGRKTPWKYQNRFGEWVTTTGMHAHPFVRPSATDPSVASQMQSELYRTVDEYVQAGWHGRSWMTKLQSLFSFKK